MNRTFFYDIHRELGGRLIEFAGWEMPVQYSSIKKEHLAVRKNAGMFDVSHMGDFFMKGEGASEFIKWLLPYDYTKLNIGQEFYTHILNENGIILDDTIVMRMSEDEYLMVPNAATTKKIYDHITPLLPENVTLEDRTMETGCIALQGPLASKILGKLTDLDLSTIESFTFTTVKVRGKDGKENEIIVSSSGYTGEAGYEIYTDEEFGPTLWGMLLEAGKEHGLEPCGLGARDTLRLEKGFLLSGTDFNDDRTMLETGCDWAIDWDHDFLGKEALLAQKDKGDYERFTGFILKDRGVPRHGMEISVNGEKAGTVTSGTMSPVLEKGIALGYVRPEFDVDGKEVEIIIRDKAHRAVVKKPPLV